MFNALRSPCALVLFWTGLLAGTAQADVLTDIDRMRVADGEVRVMTRVTLYENDVEQRQSLYEVYAGEDRRSLALVRSAVDAGQKILMLDEQFYLFMPNSRRHIRITPMQKLLGEASAGDISSLRWSEDYQVVTQTNHGDQINLHLAAARDGLSYPTMDLVVAADTHEPVSAVFYLVSGRVAKEAHFQMADEDGYRRLTGMVLQDRIQTSQRTEIEYLSVEPWDIPASWFNPAFLVRNNL